ncbi:MAG: hypothetical protein R3B98_06920 [Hyphomonas sp.]
MRALAFYERLGIRTVQIGYATDFDGAAAITQEIGATLEQPERSAALVASMPPPAGSLGLEAAYLTPSGVSAGAGTMVDSILTAAGLSNTADRPGWHSVGLERLVLSPPDIAVTAFFGFDTDAADQWSASRHPVLKKILQQAERVPLDESRLTCPAWFVAGEAAELNRRVRELN